MSISNENNRNDYVGNNATAIYNFTFKILTNSDLKVTKRGLDGTETTLLLATDYTVDGAGLDSGGTITLVAGNLPNGVVLTIERDLEIVQETELRNAGDTYLEVIEDTFDRATMVDQQQQEQIDRSIKLPITVNPSNFDPTIKELEPYAVVCINEDGDGMDLVGRDAFKGDKGDQGDLTPIEFDPVAVDVDYEDEAAVENTGTTTAPVLKFTLRAGPEGPQGESTVLITVEDELPDDGIGQNGDLWIFVKNGDANNGDFYQKESGSYVLKGNIQGPPGGVVSIDSEDGALIYDLSGLYSARFNKTIVATNLRDILADIYDIQYAAPSVTLTSDVGVGPREKGDAITAINFTAAVVKKSDPIAEVRFYQAGVLKETQNAGGAIPGGGNSTYVWTGSVSDTTTFSAQADDTGASGGPSTASGSRTFTFVYPYYYGVGAAGLDASGIAALTKDIITSNANLNRSFTVNGTQKMYFAYPKSYGALTGIFDVNNFNTIGDWTRTEKNITGLDGNAVTYYCYEFNNYAVADTYAYTFKR